MSSNSYDSKTKNIGVGAVTDPEELEGLATTIDEVDAKARMDRHVSPTSATPKHAHNFPRQKIDDKNVNLYQRNRKFVNDSGLPRPVAPDETRLADSTYHGFEDRYAYGQVLGVGGMGVVHACHDQRIGREVALKVLNPDNSVNGRFDSFIETRFEREAKIQGQLEHPGIVPIYDIGIKPDGATYFTMKRVQGLTLDAIITGLAKNDEAICAKYGLRRLLTAISQVCLTIAYAHSRGVVHRDLKPSNIILGEFGEVYVLDWGISKVAGFPRDSVTPNTRLTMSEFHDESRDAALRSVIGSVATRKGTILGTPGYLAPEQIQGALAEIDGRADVYALGAILFELLTCTPMIPRLGSANMLAIGLTGVGILPSERAPDRDIPHELDEICRRATEVNPMNRFPGVRQMHQAIEHYLDGVRDRARRHELAQEHITVAERAIWRAQKEPNVRAQEYSRAMQEVSRALALDPGNKEAIAVMMRAYVESINVLTPEAEEELLKNRSSVRQRASKHDALTFLCFLPLFPILMLLGVRSWDALIGIGVALMFASVRSYFNSRSPKMTTLSFVWTASTLGLVSTSTIMIFGPYFVLPGILLAMLIPMIIRFRSTRKERTIAIAVATMSQLIPLMLMWSGVVPSMVSFTDGVVTISPWVISFQPVATPILIILLSLITLVVPFVVIGRFIDALDIAERRLFAQTWSLRKLVPAEARGEADAQMVESEEEALNNFSKQRGHDSSRL